VGRGEEPPPALAQAVRWDMGPANRQKIDRDRFISGPDIAIFIAYQKGKTGVPLELRNRSTFDV
jgi:hypothetical protein